MFRIRRIYEKPSEIEPYRVLVDRLWPRGLSKEKAGMDEWMRDIGPGDDLRRWFGHDPTKWSAFRRKYITELQEKQDLIFKLKGLERQYDTVTLLYSSRDKEHNNAIVLREFLDS